MGKALWVRVQSKCKRNQSTVWILEMLRGAQCVRGSAQEEKEQEKMSKKPPNYVGPKGRIKYSAWAVMPLGVLNRVGTWGDLSLKELVQWFCDKEMQLWKERGWVGVTALNQRADDELRWERKVVQIQYLFWSYREDYSRTKCQVWEKGKSQERLPGFWTERWSLWLTSVASWELKEASVRIKVHFGTQ